MIATGNHWHCRFAARSTTPKGKASLCPVDDLAAADRGHAPAVYLPASEGRCLAHGQEGFRIDRFLRFQIPDGIIAAQWQMEPLSGVVAQNLHQLFHGEDPGLYQIGVEQGKGGFNAHDSESAFLHSSDVAETGANRANAHASCHCKTF